MIARLPIRVRVTLAFAAVVAVVLAGVGVFVYVELGNRLDESVNDGLETDASELAAAVQSGPLGRQIADPSGYTLFSGDDDKLTEVVSADGRLLGSSRGDDVAPVVTDEELSGLDSATYFDRDAVPGIDGAVRVRATPLEADGRELVAVVGQSLEERDEALASLAVLLAIGGPVALLLASLAGYGAAAGALRPVEAMRRRAAEISASRRDERLPVAPARDELRRLGETLNEMLARLEAAIERERRFVDDASHELRTPLALHRTELELALRHGGDEAELRRAIASAIEEVDRLSQLAEDLLVVARSEHGELALRRQRLPAGELLATVRERFRARADAAGRTLVVEPDGGVAVLGDRLRLEQALTSIVDNALRHGGGEVRLWSRANDDDVELHVSDTGRGFPPEFIARAFERFSRPGAGRAEGGTGLGLAIVETIARAHGGRAGAVNGPDGGADVWIEVPRSDPG